MSIKKKLGLGIGTAALGLSLVGGGTFAYFSDTAVQASTFASGTLDLNVNPTTNIEFKDIAPGDWIPRTFELVNNGTIDIKKVNLKTAYTIEDKAGNVVTGALADKYAQAIQVDFLTNTGDVGDRPHNVILTKSLKQLSTMNPDDVAKEGDVEGLWVLRDGIKAGSSKEAKDNLIVQFSFKDSKANDQNDLQGLKLKLNWTFEGIQRDGTVK